MSAVRGTQGGRGISVNLTKAEQPFVKKTASQPKNVTMPKVEKESLVMYKKKKCRRNPCQLASENGRCKEKIGGLQKISGTRGIIWWSLPKEGEGKSIIVRKRENRVISHKKEKKRLKALRRREHAR